MTPLHVFEFGMMERIIGSVDRGLAIEVEPRRFRLAPRELIVQLAEVYGLLCRL